ncbi:AAA family ATPase [Pseudoxanthomonas suwonensis]|uniref:AAA family ATPase n=1 Tax=Pseudoxanthomonas suwonensis TaxID=314722 RepID=UPI0009E5CC96|nr:AAA family ATPase [Pseudoxanthomonas suwonensis]
MNEISAVFQAFLENQLKPRLASAGANGRVQPVLVASSQVLLDRLWRSLTGDGNHNWVIPLGDGSTREVAVILIEETPGAGNAEVMSARATWDYAVAVRNSNAPCLILASARAWDSSQESIVQASEQLWLESPSSSRVPSADFWAEWERVVEAEDHSGAVSTSQGISKQLLEGAIDSIQSGLKGRDEDRLWEIADAMLNARSRTELVAMSGFIDFMPGTKVTEVAKTIGKLAAAAREKGLASTQALLAGAATDPVLQTAIAGLFTQIGERAGTGAAFEADWNSALADSDRRPWRDVIDHARLRDLLLAAGIDKPSGKLQLVLQQEPLNQAAKKPKAWIVRGQPTFLVTGWEGEVDVVRLEQGKRARIEKLADGSFVDSVPLLATRTTRYQAEAGRLQSDQVHVVDIEVFSPGAIVWGGASATFQLPKREEDRWVQRMTLPRSGLFAPSIFVASDTTQVTVEGWDGQDQEIEPVGGRVDLGAARVEQGLSVRLRVSRPAGQVTLDLEFEVEAIAAGTEPGAVEALLKQHFAAKPETPIAVAAVSAAREAEQAILSHADSWRGRFGGWHTGFPTTWEWKAEGVGLGDLEVPPAQVASALDGVMPPGELLAAREAVRQWLVSRRAALPEIRVDTEEFRPLAEAYLSSFIAWASVDPMHSAWFDALVIFAPEASSLGSRSVASQRPAAVLYSPMHPVRVAAIVGAQELLSGSLHLPCPLAGELSVFTQPSSSAIPLGIDPVTDTQDWLGLHRATSDQPWWHVMWAAGLGVEARALVAGQLAALGIRVSLEVPGMDTSQVARALDDIAFLSPSRTSLRVALAGSSQTRASAGAVLDWVESRFVDEKDRGGSRLLNPRSIDVLDLGNLAPAVDGQRISDVADRSAGAVAWYRGQPTSAAADLLIVEGLGQERSDKAVGSTRSAVSPGTLFRIDPAREGASRVLVEPRRTDRVLSLDVLARGLEEACVHFETLAGDRAGADHVERRPPGVSELLGLAKYVALGSGEVDPSLLASTIHDKGALVWDYELPVPAEPLKSTEGYYLLATATEAQKRRVDEALRLVVEAAEADPAEVLAEISSRGIPLLRRFAAGGSTTRGELGLFLAVRLLQGRTGSPSGAAIPSFESGAINLLVSVDSYSHYLRLLRHSLSGLGYAISERMPDLLLVSYRPGESPALKLTPIEVKFRGSSIEQAHLLKGHLDQAASLGTLLKAVFEDLAGKSRLWDQASRAWLGSMLNHAFRVYSFRGLTAASQSEWSGAHSDCIRALLEERAAISIESKGRLLVFDASTQSLAEDADGDYAADTVRVGHFDSRRLVLDEKWRKDLANAVAEVFGFPPRPDSVEEGVPGPASGSGGSAGEPVPEVDQGAHPADSGAAKATPTEPEKATSVQPSTSSPYQDARVAVARTFDGFIGNSNAIDRVSRDLVVAITSTPRALSKSFLFSGPPSSGKTELCRRIARAIGLPFVSLDGTALKSREKLFDLVDASLKEAGTQSRPGPTVSGLPVVEYPPFVVFVDEVHLVSRPVQESFLTALESKDRRVHLGNRYAQLTNATFLFATTRPSNVDPALRSRCEMIVLTPYTTAEVAAMIGLAFPGWPAAVTERVATLGRRVPRIALRLAEDLSNEAKINQVQGNAEADLLPHLETIRKERQLDLDGFGPTEYEYMRALQAANGRPLGLESIAAHLRSVPVETIESEIEPFLLQEHAIEFTGRGRQLTKAGHDRLSRRRT